jgi:ABC-type glycerol-3-phosphate transport system permease component
MSGRPRFTAQAQPSAIRGRAAYMGTIYAILIVLSIILLFPMWWMIVVSLETAEDARQAAVSAEGFDALSQHASIQELPGSPDPDGL